jgi:C1A family cysteine protease
LTIKSTTTAKLTAPAPGTFNITKLPSILDQGSIGSCVSNAFVFSINTQTNNYLNISRMFHYAICRILQHTPLSQDAGTSIRTACKAITSYGAAAETAYPYNTALLSSCPPLSTFQGSKYFRKFTYVFVNQDITSIKNCLSTYKVPIIFGFMVYSSFLTQQVARTGMVPVPKTRTEAFRGGHCMNIIGYNDTTQRFTCVNSWGTSWGNKGICYVPYQYLMNSALARDFCFTQFIY